MTHSIRKTPSGGVGIYSTNPDDFIFRNTGLDCLKKAYKEWSMKQLELGFEVMWKRMIKRFQND